MSDRASGRWVEKIPPGLSAPGVVCLRPFDGADGVDTTPEELRLHRGGKLVESVSGPAVENEAPVLDPYAGLGCSSGFEWAAAVARYFPDETFCWREPVSFELSARVGTAGLAEDLAAAGTSVRAFYEPSLFESFDGELSFDRITVAGGTETAGDAGPATGPATGSAMEPATGSYQEWRRDVGNLDGYPAYRRRVVDLSLPREPRALREHTGDLVLLYRIAAAVCELLHRYVESGGEETVYAAGRIDNLFPGGEPGPLPRRIAPVIYGRSVNDVYRPAAFERLVGG